MIRKANASDVPRIRVLMQSVPGSWQAWWSDETIAKAIDSLNALVFVSEDGSQLLGFVGAHDLGFRAYVSELVVDNRVRHKGVGTSLLRAVEEALRCRNQRIVIADVWYDAEPLYRSLGWEPPNAVLLRLRLDPSPCL